MSGEAYCSLRKEYAGHARDYDRHWHRYVQASVQRTIERIRPAAGELVLDVGCGTGILLERLCKQQPDGRYSGIDLSERMLAVARSRLPQDAGLYQAAAEALPFADCRFDLLVSSSVFHFIRHPEAALGEMFRVLQPGGRLVITDWCADYLSMRLLDRYLQFSGQAHHQTYHSAGLARLLADCGFVDVAVDRFRIDWFWGLFTATAMRHTTATAPRYETRGPARQWRDCGG